MPDPVTIATIGLGALNLLGGSKRAGESNKLQQQAIDIALQDRAERQPLREAFTSGALSPIAEAPDLSGVFQDPTNPFSGQAGPVEHVGSQLDFSGVDLARTAKPRGQTVRDPTTGKERPLDSLPPIGRRRAGDMADQGAKNAMLDALREAGVGGIVTDPESGNSRTLDSLPPIGRRRAREVGNLSTSALPPIPPTGPQIQPPAPQVPTGPGPVINPRIPSSVAKELDQLIRRY